MKGKETIATKEREFGFCIRKPNGKYSLVRFLIERERNQEERKEEIRKRKKEKHRGG